TDNGGIVKINSTDYTVAAPIHVTGCPFGGAFASSNGYLYVGTLCFIAQGNQSILEIQAFNTATDNVTTTIPGANRPVMYDANNSMIYAMTTVNGASALEK